MCQEGWVCWWVVAARDADGAAALAKLSHVCGGRKERLEHSILVQVTLRGLLTKSYRKVPNFHKRFTVDRIQAQDELLCHGVAQEFMQALRPSSVENIIKWI